MFIILRARGFHDGVDQFDIVGPGLPEVIFDDLGCRNYSGEAGAVKVSFVSLHQTVEEAKEALDRLRQAK